ncbi:hypothetical protein O3P69_001800 [Scylla paramamosain]|uniref:CLIP domain-containing serine protease n=1 Tax=Scylla paramamosain TaxID=85552 RepID=A0AAW0V2D1_SCYPA
MVRYEFLTLVVVAVTALVHCHHECRTRTGQEGRCVSIRQCPEMQALLQSITSNGAQSGSMQWLRDSVCDFQDETPKVCCKYRHSLASRGASLLPTDCGRTVLVDRIVGGVDASLFSWPWIALLNGRNTRGNFWICGGVLISDRYVLTAAHCVHGSSRYLLDFVRIGEHQLTKNPDCERRVCAPSPQDIRVEEIVVHDDYGRVQGCPRCHDIALLRLATPAQLNPAHVVPICLPMNIEKDLGIVNNDFSSKFAWTAGWGTIDPARTVPADILQEVFLPLSKTYCNTSSYPDPNMVLCAGGEGADSCAGDSGGPLVMENPRVNINYVVGLVSNGPTVCGARKTQGYYTNVHYYIPWILRHLH